MTSQGPFLYPNVTTVPQKSDVQSDRAGGLNKGADKAEFDRAFDRAISEQQVPGSLQDLNQVRSPLKFSAHASQRLRDRKITLDAATMGRVNDALDRAEAKGVEDTLVLTSDAALIVSVKNRTVVTAMDRNQLTGNVFTNIDGEVIV